MLSYSEIYEYLRKEKSGESLQELPKNFVVQFSEYLMVKKKQFAQEDEFSIDIAKDKKQFENALALFKELMLRRKKKILSLVFIAAETGLMKRDFTDMLSFEQELFGEIIKAVDSGDRKLSSMLNGKNETKGENKKILVNEKIEQFVDMNGGLVGPFEKGELINIEGKVAEILVS